MKVENLTLNVIIVDGKVDNIGDILKKHISDIVGNSKTIVLNGTDSSDDINSKNKEDVSVEKDVVVDSIAKSENNKVEDVVPEEVVENNNNHVENKDVKDDSNLINVIPKIKDKIVKFGYYSYTYSNELAIYALVNKGITNEEFGMVCPDYVGKNLSDLINIYSNALVRNVDLPHDSKFRIDMKKVKKVASTSEITASILDIPAGCVCEVTHNGVNEIIMLRLNHAKNAFCNYGNIIDIFGDKLSCITVGGVNKKHKELFPNTTSAKPAYF